MVLLENTTNDELGPVLALLAGRAFHARSPLRNGVPHYSHGPQDISPTLELVLLARLLLVGLLVRIEWVDAQ